MRNIRLLLQMLFLISLAASLNTCAKSTALNGVVVSPANISIPTGVTQQFTALGYYNDGSTRDLTTQVTWTSSDTNIATINSSGLATGIGGGTTIITATSSISSSYTNLGSVGSTTLTVYSATLSSISLTPLNPSIPLGVTQQFTATGTFSNGTTFDITPLVTWISSNSAVVTISSTGLATVLSAGPAIITATSGTISGSTTLTGNSATLSSISVTPANPSIPVGVTQQFTATGGFSDGTSFDITPLVAWDSLNPAVITIRSTGLATVLSAGTATITASSGAIVGSTTLTGNSATLSSISVTPANPSIPIGISQQFAATGLFSDGTSFNITTMVAWASSNPALATVGSTGLATGLARGAVAITATSGSISGSATLTVNSAILTAISVTPIFPLITVGANLQMKATGIYTDGTSYDLTSLVVWTSSNTAVATVSTTGVATGLAATTTTITAAISIVPGNTILTVQ